MKHLARYFKLFFVVFIIAIILTEFSLRRLNYTPGTYIYSQWFKSVESLKILPGPSTGEDGIFKYSPETVATFRQLLSSDPQGAKANAAMYPPEIFGLVQESFKIANNQLQNDFTEVYQRILKKEVLSDYDRAVLAYVKSPINDEGFRSIPFKPYKSEKKKILLLGDSFTWGHVATAKSNSFADLLLEKGYIVYNAGMTGADSAQYLAIARKYIPIVKPDLVIANFFLGNDVSYYKRDPRPNLPLFFSTNAGNLYSFSDGIYLDSAEARYNFILRNYSIPTENSWLNKFAAQTCLGTLFWKILLKKNLVDNRPRVDLEYWSQSKELQYQKPYSNIEMDLIRQLTDSAKIQFLLVTITDYIDSPFIRNPESIYGLFENTKFHNSPVDVSGYDMTNGHFNDIGHKKYAEYLLSLIEEKQPVRSQ